jgi:group I intron endonuclease
MIIYCATNKSNNKKYIGQSVKTLEERKCGHLTASKRSNRKISYFGKAILKYGIDGFVWEIIDNCLSINDMNKKEKYYIAKYNTTNKNFGYNISFGGRGNVGYKHSAETKRIISERTSKALLGHKLSQETKNKISLAHIGYKHTVESKLKMSKFRLGKKTWNTGLKMNNEYKQKRSIGGLGKKKLGTSIAMKNRWAIFRQLSE